MLGGVLTENPDFFRAHELQDDVADDSDGNDESCVLHATTPATLSSSKGEVSSFTYS